MGLIVSSAADGAGATPEAAMINDAIGMATSSLSIACLDAVMPMHASSPDGAAHNAGAPRTAAPPITCRETALAGDWVRSWKGLYRVPLSRGHSPAAYPDLRAQMAL